MNRMFAGAGIAVVLPMLLALGGTGCAGSGPQAEESQAEQACEPQPKRSTSSRISRRSCEDRNDGD